MTATCPCCNDEIEVSDDAEEQDEVTCSGCAADLYVSQTNPIVLSDSDEDDELMDDDDDEDFDEDFEDDDDDDFDQEDEEDEDE